MNLPIKYSSELTTEENAQYPEGITYPSRKDGVFIKHHRYRKN
jgi:hypothetical protein